MMVKEDLTLKQREILTQLTDKAQSVRQIAHTCNVSQQAVYAQLRTIIKKGWLRKEYRANYEKVE
ncbi:MAG: hypothetical protein DRR04_05385 [Gammaproteobacteria bacterium]|nr:MAG: hypothetical protein DRQ97_06820 [Gammaproteobacteria bacterium]RLA60561.1 MAG: hypothetical protein DRR04_05385 [Gammaproteobacteria bacterium]